MSKFYRIKGCTKSSLRHDITNQVKDAKVCEISILPFGEIIAAKMDFKETDTDKYAVDNLKRWGIGDVLTREDDPNRYGFITKGNIEESGYYAATRLCIMKFMQMVTAETDTNKIAIICSTADFVDGRDCSEFECTFEEIVDTLYPEYELTVMFLEEKRSGELDGLIDNEDDD